MIGKSGPGDFVMHDDMASGFATGLSPSVEPLCVSPVPASIPDAAPRKTAQIGTRMVKFSDARGAAMKIKYFAIKAMQQAEEEGRDDDRELYLAKVRTATAIANEILLDIPVFINAAIAIEAAEADETRSGSGR